MNTIIDFLKNKYVLGTIIMLMIFLIIYLLKDNFLDKFENLTGLNRLPPHVERLSLQQMMPQDPPALDQTPSTYTNYNIDAPNFKRNNKSNNIKSTSMISGNSYRMKTGREAFEQEQFVSIYDSNFGGLLGTTMGL